jgi:hypothetical protein
VDEWVAFIFLIHEVHTSARETGYPEGLCGFLQCSIFLPWRWGGSSIQALAYYAFPRWYEFGELRWNDTLTGEKRRTRRKTCPSATFSATYPTWIDRVANLGLSCERPATNDVSHGTAQCSIHYSLIISSLEATYIVWAVDSVAK